MRRPERRVLCTLGVGAAHAELYRITRPTFERYAVMHDLDLVAQTEPVELRGRPAAWGKFVLVRALLERYDTVVWIDADAVIVDPRRDITAGLSSRRPMHLVWHRIGHLLVPNTGVFVIRRGRAATRLLESVWACHEYIHHRWWENAALIAELGGDADFGLTELEASGARRRVGELDHRWNSTPPCPARNPAIVHLAGVDHQDRCEQMTELVRTATMTTSLAGRSR
jgi:hypothetical protein